MRLSLIMCILFVVNCAVSAKQKVDLIVHNAVVYTVDQKFSKVEAIAVNHGRIIATGTNKNILSTYSGKRIINAGGKAVYPGFIDAHAHFTGFGRSLFQVNVFGANSWEEVLARVKKFAAQHPGENWLLGRGWDQNKFPGKSFPDNEELSKMFPDKPVMLTRVDGHAVIVNRKAIEMAGIVPGQKVQGGEVETKNGRLTGILVDNAADLVKAARPGTTLDEQAKWLRAAQQKSFETGLTTISDCGLMYNDIDVIDKLQKAKRLDIRVYAMLADDAENYRRYLHKKPYKSDKLFVKGIKLYADGALGSRGACLLEPYSDRQGWHGFLLKDKKYFDSIARVVIKTDYQLCTHAIGDSGNRMVLSVYNKVLKGKNDLRWRIEHAQVINKNDFAMFGSASVIPSVQSTHATSDMYWAGERLGKEREKGAYAFKQLLDENGWIPLGTDCPVEDISTFKTFLAAVVRKDAKGYPPQGYQTENALSREEAIRGMTIWAAKGCFLEKEVGSIERGKKADFIILDTDLMTVPETRILDVKVIATYLGGNKVYEANK